MLLLRFLLLVLAVVAVAVLAVLADTWWMGLIAVVVLIVLTAAAVLLAMHYMGAPGWLGPREQAQLEEELLVEPETGLPTRRRWNARQARKYAEEVARGGLVAVPGGWRGPDAAHRVLLVTTGAISAEQLCAALPDPPSPDDLAVLVVVPTLAATAGQFRAGDAPEAVKHAEQIARDTVDTLAAAGVQVSAHIGPADPAVAISDGLRTYDADRVVVARHREPLRYLEDVDVAGAAEAFGKPLHEISLRAVPHGS